MTSTKQMEFLLEASETSIETQIRRLNSILNNISKISDDYVEVSKRVEGLLIEIEDIKYDILNYSLDLEGGKQKIIDIEKRLDLIYSLQKNILLTL